jgi:hypothetical protein
MIECSIPKTADTKAANAVLQRSARNDYTDTPIPPPQAHRRFCESRIRRTGNAFSSAGPVLLVVEVFF